MKTRITTLTILLSIFTLSVGWAQQKRAIAFTAAPDSGEYLQDHRVEVGDVPGHIVRVIQVTWDVSQMEPVPSFNGVAVTAVTSSSMTDYYDFNGLGQGYLVFTLENGDKIFSDFNGATHTAFLDDGSPSSSHFSGIMTLTGGTGDFKGIRGLIRQVTDWNLATDKSHTQPTTFEGEYWFIDGGMASR